MADKNVKPTAAKQPAKPGKPADNKAAVDKSAMTKEVKRAENRLRIHYRQNCIPALMTKFGYKNVNEVPKLEKVVINMGLGDVKDNSKSFQLHVEELRKISGQKPVVTAAKKSVANFKVRQGMNIGAKVTLRNARMYEFIDKLIAISLPRVRDFRGINPSSFDGRGNYTLGLKEQLIFTEIVYDQVEKTRGFDVTFVTTAKTDAEAKELLKLLGMPFRA